MKVKKLSDDNLLLNIMLKLDVLIVTVRSSFEEDG